VAVIVGKEKRVLRIHKGVLTYHSAYFATALDGGWQRGDTGGLELEEEDTEVFHAFYCWIYTRLI
jgi:Ser-tRNA(Ala) deacylase AlaX